MNPAHIWLLIGVVLVAAEAIGISGIGLLFAGLGALTAGALIQLGLIAEGATVTQFTAAFMATAAWALLLWKWLKKLKHKQSSYSNIIGDTAFVGSGGLKKKTPGEVTWSGTIVRAELAKGAVIDTLEAGSQVKIVGVSGAKLIVEPKE